MKLFTIQMRAMSEITERQLTGLLSGLRYRETPASMRAILTDGSPSNAAEHIKEQYVSEITDVLDSLGLEYDLIAE